MYRWTMYSTGCINGCMSKMEHVCLYSFVVEFDSADVSYVESKTLHYFELPGTPTRNFFFFNLRFF